MPPAAELLELDEPPAPELLELDEPPELVDPDPVIRVAHVIIPPAGAPDPPLALVDVQVLLLYESPTEIDLSAPHSDSQMVSEMQMSPLMQKCLFFVAILHSYSFTALHASEFPLQLVTD